MHPELDSSIHPSDHDAWMDEWSLIGILDAIQQ